MGEISKIEWCDGTWNPWEGCQKVGPGCDHCYAEARNQRFSKGENWGVKAPRRRTSEHTQSLLRRLNRQHEKFLAAHGRHRAIFCSSLCDIFDNAVAQEWRQSAYQEIEQADKLDIIMLTKRVGNVEHMVPEHWLFGAWPRHAGLMITVVNQQEADRDIPKLLDLKERFNIPWVGLSMEPLLGPVYLTDYFLAIELSENTAIDWVIVGGESGPHARPMHPDWAVSLRAQCLKAGVPFLFKQWGNHLHERLFNPAANAQPEILTVKGERYIKTTKERAGRYLHPWGYVNEFPHAFRTVVSTGKLS